MDFIRLSAAIAVAATLTGSALADDFAIKSGDRVVFYGDSITENAPYDSFIEVFVADRYPSLRASFMNAGVGGDRVTGGWMGPIDVRLTRDLFSRKPTVVTCMLGMNDAGYQPFNQGLLDTYESGYKHIVDRLKKEAPGARVWLIQPSPYDDVTRPVVFPGGYNAVLLKYSDFVKDLANQNGYGLIDQNAPMVDMLTKANAADPKAAAQLIPDRIHPQSAGHLLMAADILKAWKADPIVSETTIDWKSGAATTVHSKLSHWNAGSFDLKEDSLPFAIVQNDPLFSLVMKSSDVESDLNVETLKINNMQDGNYTLSIDGKAVGDFSSDDFSKGIEMSKLPTPMYFQAMQVLNLGMKLSNLQFNRWRTFEFGLSELDLKSRLDAIKSVEKLEDDISNLQHETAQPKEHHFEIVKKA